MMDTMRVRPWISGLEEDDTFELNFDLNDDLLLKVCPCFFSVLLCDDYRQHM